MTGLYSKLSDDDKKKWLDTANAAYSMLTADGVNEESASKRSMMKADAQFAFEGVTVPESALIFSENDIVLKFEKGEGAEEETTRLDMVGYSGGVIKDHWWWDDLAIDLDGVQFTAEKFPILENHDTDRKIAFTGKPIVNEKGICADPETTVFLENDVSRDFVSNSKKGFPYQSSIYVQPTSIERVEKDETVEVNGFTLKGPGTVFRKCEFKEMSACVFGWDNNTNATAFNKGIVLGKGCEVSKKFSEPVFDDDHSSHNDKPEMEDVTMDVTKLKADHPELYQEVFSLGAASGKDDAEKGFKEQKDAMDAKFADMDEKLLVFSKAETIRTERELQQDARILFTDKLNQSDVPEHLHEKVRQLVSYTKFMKEGKLDKVAFSEAIDAEIASWIDAGVSQSVMGSSFSTDDPGAADAAEKLTKQIDDCADDLLGLV